MVLDSSMMQQRWGQCPWWEGLKTAYTDHTDHLMLQDPCTFNDGEGFPPPSGDEASLQHLQNLLAGGDGQTDLCANKGRSIKAKMNTRCPPSDYRADTMMPTTGSTTRPLTTDKRKWIQIDETQPILPATRSAPYSQRATREERTTDKRKWIQFYATQPILPATRSAPYSQRATREERRPISPQVGQPVGNQTSVGLAEHGHLVGVNDKMKRPTGPNKAPVIHRQPQPSYSYRKGRSLPIRQPNGKNRGSTQDPAPRNRLPTLDWDNGSFDWSQNCKSIMDSELQESCIQHFAKDVV